MLIIGDVEAALAALHRGDLGAFRFQKNHREAKFDPNADKIETARSALRNLAAASGHWSPFSIVGLASVAKADGVPGVDRCTTRRSRLAVRRENARLLSLNPAVLDITSTG